MACNRQGAYTLSLSSTSSFTCIWDVLQRERPTIAKRHHHAVAHPLHCSAMPHIACHLAVARGLQETSRRHSRLRYHMLAVMPQIAQRFMSVRPWCKHVQVL